MRPQARVTGGYLSRAHSWIFFLICVACVLGGLVAGGALVTIPAAILEGAFRIQVNTALFTVLVLLGLLAGGALPAFLLLRARRSQSRRAHVETHSMAAVPMPSEEEVARQSKAPSGSGTRPDDGTVEWPDDNRTSYSHPGNAHKRWRLRYLVIIGAIILAALLGITAAYRFDDPSLGLEVKADRDPVGGVGAGATITNVGNNAIHVIDVTINDRDDCKPKPLTGALGGERNEIALLKVGDTLGLITRCGIVRMTIKTDRGSAEYSFRGN